MRYDSTLIYLFVVLLSILASCSGKSSSNAGEDSDLRESSQYSGKDGETQRLPDIGKEDVNPKISLSGSDELVPSKLVVTFDRYLSRSMGKVNADLEFRPEIEGRWKQASQNKLVFRAKETFRPNTEYDLVIHSLTLARPANGVKTLEETVEFDKPLSRSFQTPPFKLVQMHKPVAGGTRRAGGCRTSVFGSAIGCRTFKMGELAEFRRAAHRYLL